MEEIEEKLKELSNCIYVLIICSALSLLGLLTVIIPADSNFKSLKRLEEMSNDCEELKKENEILLNKVQFYREKYEKMP